MLTHQMTEPSIFSAKFGEISRRYPEYILNNSIRFLHDKPYNIKMLTPEITAILFTQGLPYNNNNNNNNNNSHDNVYGAVIMTKSYCESSPGSSDECRLSAGWPPTLRPSQSTWAVSPPKIGSYHPHSPSPLLLLLSQ